MAIALLPLLLYGVYLAFSGDFLLLSISLASFGINFLPQLFRDKEPVRTHDAASLGVFDRERRAFILPPPAITGDISIVTQPEIGYRFLRQLFSGTSEEIWCLGECNLDCYRKIVMGSATEEDDMADLSSRSRISLPFTLIAKTADWHRLSNPLLSENRSFRLVLVGDQAINTPSQIALSVMGGELRAVGNLGAEEVELTVREQLLAGEPANDFRNEGAPAGGSFKLVGHTSGDHSSARGNKSKRFNFPVGRSVIHKAETGFRTGSAENQISQGFASEVRSADPIADITARLRQLGHGI
jgi:hypothetical protein